MDGGGDDPEAIDVLRRAARAVAPFMPSAAGDLIAHAFSLVPRNDPQLIAYGLEAIDILAGAKRGLDAIVVADRLLEVNIDDEVAAHVQTQIVRLLWEMGHLEKMASRVESALARAGATAESHAELLALRALSLSTADDRPAAFAAGELALDESRRIFARLAERDALRALGESSRNDGRHGVALGYFREMHAIDAEDSFVDEVMSLQLIDRYDLSGDRLREARDDRDGRHDALHAPKIALGQMWHDYALGRLDAAEADAVTLQRLCERVQRPSFEFEAYLIRCRIAQLHGLVTAAREHLEAAIHHADEHNESHVYMLLFMSAWQSQYEGDVQAAAAIVRRVVLPLHGIKHRWRWQAAWLVTATQITVAAHDFALANRVAEQARVLAEQNPAVATIQGIAAHAEGLALGDVSRLRAAVALLRASPRPLIRANAFADLGSAELRTGHRDDGIAALDHAWEIYDRAGAAGEALAIQRLLHGAGLRRRRWTAPPARPLHGWGALTIAEQSVARLIADGHTNRTAASELLLSPNTIATHLRSIFGKLDVKSRVQLTLAVIGHT